MADEPVPTHAPSDGSDAAILRDHVMGMKAYHALRIRFTALVCAVQSQAGVTINGSMPTPREACTKGDDDPVEHER